MSQDPAQPVPARPISRTTLTHVAIAVGFALVVAGGAKIAASLTATTMMNISLLGAWLILMLGLAYAGVRMQPRLGAALLTGFGIGLLLVLIFGGMAMLG